MQECVLLSCFRSAIKMNVEWCFERGRSVKNLISGSLRYGWLRKSKMNRITLGFVFICGVVCAVLVAILSEYIRMFTDENHDNNMGSKRIQQSRFSLLPDTNAIRATDESSLEIAVSQSYLIVSDRDSTKPGMNAASVSEALSSLHAALEMKKAQKHDKALKLFQHAVALAPKHPDILNYFGEFLEETKNDTVAADQLYFQALTYSPGHSRAMINRHRTMHVVEQIDQNTLRKIDEKRDTLTNIPDSSAALQRVKKEAYFQHIYHTVGIEGNTMTLSQTRSIVETHMAIAGKSILEHNEILGLDAALKYVNSTLVHRIGAIKLNDILEIHKRVVGYVDPLEAGMFRRTQVYVGDHIPPGPLKIQVMMEQFLDWLNSERALRMHPIRYAAVAHYKLVYIHPFNDGNGRTSRLLMNMILMQAGYPPVIILKQDRQKYYEYLEVANEGDIRPFVRFIAECTERTLDVYLWATKEYSVEFPALEQEESQKIILEDGENG